MAVVVDNVMGIYTLMDMIQNIEQSFMFTIKHRMLYNFYINIMLMVIAIQFQTILICINICSVWKNIN